MRRPFTTANAVENGISKEALKWAVRIGEMQRPFRGIYVKGKAPVSDVEIALCTLVASGGVSSHALAGILHGLDGVELRAPFATVAVQRQNCCVRVLAPERIETVRGYRCTDGLQTMLDLSGVLGDREWEQALESALRKGLTTIANIEAELPRLSKQRASGLARIRRVLALRPPGAPPTESMLETLAVQLIRRDASLPTPTRQVEVFDDRGVFIARVDLAFPDHGSFLELDGGHHKNQPKYDANRQTAVSAAKRWLVGRFEWDDITRFQNQTLRRLRQLLL